MKIVGYKQPQTVEAQKTEKPADGKADGNKPQGKKPADGKK